ncbi:MAG: NF038122 family metalloprotease [Candidatus Acidiferrum sp.]|jgi:hypothetical protein
MIKQLGRLAAGMAFLAVLTLAAAQAGAGTITYTCDPSVAASTCNYLNTTIAGQYSSTFTNASADIYIEYGTTALASTSSYLNEVSYSSYLSALAANTNQSSIQADALSALHTYDSGAYGSGNVEITDALGTALGLTAGLTGTTAGGAACSFPSAGCYNAVVTVTNDPATPLYYDNLGGPEAADAVDFYATVEHQTNEVLGTSSCISTQGGSLSNACSASGAATPSAVDLFRYSAPGSLVLDSSLSTTPGAYFSYNGGLTNGANGFVYNTLANGDDYADFVTNCSGGPLSLSVQDAEGCPGLDAGLNIRNDGGAEINILNAVGYDVYPSTSTATPEPDSTPLTLSGIGFLLGWMLTMRKRLDFPRSV